MKHHKEESRMWEKYVISRNSKWKNILYSEGKRQFRYGVGPFFICREMRFAKSRWQNKLRQLISKCSPLLHVSRRVYESLIPFGPQEAKGNWQFQDNGPSLVFKSTKDYLKKEKTDVIFAEPYSWPKLQTREVICLALYTRTTNNIIRKSMQKWDSIREYFLRHLMINSVFHVLENNGGVLENNMLLNFLKFSFPTCGGLIIL